MRLRSAEDILHFPLQVQVVVGSFAFIRIIWVCIENGSVSGLYFCHNGSVWILGNPGYIF